MTHRGESTVWPDLTRRQAAGQDCVICRWPYDIAPVPSTVVGVAPDGREVLACVTAKCASAVSETVAGQLAIGGAS